MIGLRKSLEQLYIYEDAITHFMNSVFNIFYSSNHVCCVICVYNFCSATIKKKTKQNKIASGDQDRSLTFRCALDGFGGHLFRHPHWKQLLY